MAPTHTDKTELIIGLETAVTASPENVELRLLLVGHLAEAGHHGDAFTHATTVVQTHPDRTDAYRHAAQAARALGDPRAAAFERVANALAVADGAVERSPRPAQTSAPAHPRAAAPVVATTPAPARTETAPRPEPAPESAAAPAPARTEAAPRPEPAPESATAPVAPDPAPEAPRSRRARRQAAAARPEAVAEAPESTSESHDSETVAEVAPPKQGRRGRGGALKRRQQAEKAAAEVEIEPFPELPETVDAPEGDADVDAEAVAPDAAGADVDIDDDEVWEAPSERFEIAPDSIQRPTVTLASIATDAVRDRFEAVVVNPLRHGGGARSSTRGGVLLFGPDGCGKGFFARIVAGELRANFLRVDMAESMQWPGDPRENIGTIFEAARSALPCVLYLDHIDRAGTHPDNPDDAADRRLLSRLASEIASAASNRGLIIFGGTTAPWGVDMTLLSNGRLDRSLVVLPPDAPAREMILRDALSDAALSGVDLPWIIERTRHFSADDLVGLTNRAKALATINALGDDVVVGPGEMTRAFREVRPAAPAWFAHVHENAVGGGSQDGMYDEVMTYMDVNQLV